ncbi:MAG: acetyl-CoA carboxylase biotin carboxylase subunit [Alphaproteobacteria bacterium]|nr:acetyl-CoA carboxylase biotin carboxylase subunit [Alphaproteobacteria bacterium]
MFDKILIAARGEIALRIHRACREMGIKTVAVHSTVDADAMHVKLADESVCIGPAAAIDSYLNKANIIAAAMLTGADAIHPGYGFLAENADFADMVEAHGIKFIGPKPQMIRQMGDKINARRLAQDAGLPIIPGSSLLRNVQEAMESARKIGYPVLVKAAAGGGGKGMRLAHNEQELPQAFALAQNEARKAFGNPDLYMEKYLETPRHIEVQILADDFGNVIHLGERDCSIQRNNQKIIEETPSPALNAEQRESLGRMTVNAVKKLGYTNVGTVEYLYQNGQFYFMEMNTRVQVEHPITEMLYTFDIVREQIQLAAGLPLSVEQSELRPTGHVIECRINAEDPTNFRPCPGKITGWHVPGGLSVRVDSGMYAGCVVPPNYDSLVAKLIVAGRTRNGMLLRLKRALNEFVIEGVQTTIPLLQEIINTPDFVDGRYFNHWLQEFLEDRKKNNF